MLDSHEDGVIVLYFIVSISIISYWISRYLIYVRALALIALRRPVTAKSRLNRSNSRDPSTVGLTSEVAL